MVCAYLASLKNELKVPRLSVHEVRAAERSAGLHTGRPGKGRDTEPLHSMRAGVAAAKDNARDACLQEKFANDGAEGRAESFTRCRGWRITERSVEDSVLPSSELRGSLMGK